MSSDSDPAVEAIQQTLIAFRAQCDEWGQEFDVLLDQLETLPAPSAVTGVELDQLINTLTGHQQHVARRQDAIGDELAAVHQLVERQVELLDTLQGNLNGSPTGDEG